MMKRPEINGEIILAAADKIADQLDCNAQTIADAYCPHMDGFELAKKLDRQGWDISAQDVEILDSMGSYVDEEHEKVCKKWFKENNIQPPLDLGTKIKEGVIKGICQYSVGRYLVKENGCTDDSRHLLILFEDAVAV